MEKTLHLCKKSVGSPRHPREIDSNMALKVDRLKRSLDCGGVVAPADFDEKLVAKPAKTMVNFRYRPDDLHVCQQKIHPSVSSVSTAGSKCTEVASPEREFST